MEKESISNQSKIESLQLRKIIKENHGSPIVSIMFNMDETNGEVLATAGGNLVSIYDNNHCGEGHLDLTCFFTNERTEYAQGGAVTCLTWLKVPPAPQTWCSQAFLAFGSKSGEISIVNLAETCVDRLFKAHSAAVDFIVANPLHPGYFISCSVDDKLVQSWNAFAEDEIKANLQVFSYAATSIAISPNGTRVALGSASGKIESFELTERFTITPSSFWVWKGKSRVDCMEYLSDDAILAHDINGKMTVICARTGAEIRSFAVPKGENAHGKSVQCQFGISPCKQFVCCGNSSGEVFVYHIESSTRIKKLSMPRIKGAVKACKFTPGCKSILLCTDDSFLWRWDIPTVTSSVNPASMELTN